MAGGAHFFPREEIPVPDNNDSNQKGQDDRGAGGDKKPAPRPRSGQITFVTGVHYHRGKKKLYVTRRKLVFKNGLLVEVGDTGPAEEIDVRAFREKEQRE